MTQVLRGARERMERVVYIAAGVGAIVFGALQSVGAGGFLAQRDQLALWFWIATLTFAVLLPLSLIVVARISVTGARTISRVAVLGFIACQLLWVPAMTVPVLADGGDPWLQGINALPATLAAVAWRSRWVWAVPASQGPIVALVQIQASSGPVLDAVLDGLGAVMFCSVLAGVAMAVVSAAGLQDEAAERARNQASLDARRRTEERELGRIDAIVHDDIMSVLLVASRPNPPPTLAAQAQHALKAVTLIASPDRDAPAEYTPAELIALLRATVSDAMPGQDLTYELRGELPIPGLVAAAFAEALGEALRNVVNHAGPDVALKASVAVEDDAVVVAVEDNGRGFEPQSVPATRLGLKVSVVDRMSSIDGGAASITSRPGRGTWVTLMWRRP